MGSLTNAALTGTVISVLGIGIAFLIYQRRLGRHRGVSRNQFIAAFSDSHQQEIAATVYEYYTGQALSKKFGIAPDDEVGAVFSKGDEDIDDDVVFLMKALGLYEPKGFAEQRAETEIKTIRDIVHWLDWIRRYQ